MSTSATVGTLKVLLQADTAAFTAAMSTATADVQKIGAALQKDLEPRQRAVNAAVRDFLGTDEIRRANEYVAALQRIGGTSTLTEANQRKVNRAVTDALDQYRALGQEAPDALTRIRDETLKQENAWGRANTALSKFGLSIGSLTLAGAVTSFISAGREAISFGSHLTDLRDQTGLTLDELQRLNYAGATVGLSIDQIAGSVNKLQKNLGTEGSGVTQSLKTLNLNLSDLQAMSPGAMFEAMADAIGKVENPTTRTQVAMALLGKSGAELLPLLLAKVKELGDAAPKMSDDTIEALDRVDDAWAKLKINVQVEIGNLIGSVSSLRAAMNTILGQDVTNTLYNVSDQWKKNSKDLDAFSASLDRWKPSAKDLPPTMLAAAEAEAEFTRTMGPQIEALKKNTAAAEAHQKAIAALADTYTGKALAQHVNDISAAYALAVKQGGLLGQQVFALSVELQKLRDQGAVLPPRLNLLADAFSRNAQVIQRELLPLLPYLYDGVQNGERSLRDLELQFDRLVTPIGKVQKTIQDQLGPALKKLPPPPGLEADWVKALSGVSESFAQLAQIAGGSMSAIARSIGTVISSVSQVGQSLKTIKDSAAIGGLAGAAGVASGVGAIFGAEVMVTNAIVGAMESYKVKQTMRQVAKDFGVAISEELAAAIRSVPNQATPKVFSPHGGEQNQATKDYYAQIGMNGTQLGELLNIDKIIEAGGGLTQKTFDTWVERSRKLFDVIKAGGTGATMATDTLARTLHLFADQAGTTGTLWSRSFQGMLSDAKALGVGLDDIKTLLEGQLSTIAAASVKVAGGLTGSLASPGKTLDELTSKQKDQTDRGDLSGAEETAKQIKDLTTKTVADLQPEFDRLNRITLASFNAYIAQGHTAVEAIAAVGPAFDQLKAAADKFGFAGSEAFNQLSHWRDLTTQNQPLLDQVSGLNDLMVALANVGSLDASTFADLQAQGVATFQQLTAAGFTQNEALAQMAPMLQTIKDLHDQNGLAIDDATQALINQADAQGVLKDKQESTQDVLMEGLGAIIKAVGGDMPAAWEKAAKAGKDAAKDIKGALSDIPDKTVKINFDTSDWPNTNDWPQPNGDGGGAGTPDPGNAPGYAVGGVVQPKPGGRLVRVAEAGYAETILPGNWSDLLEATRRMPNWDGAMAGVGLSAAGMTAPESAGPMSLNIGVGDVHIDGKKAGKVLWKPMVEDLQRRQLTR
jgi:hypothetical protein